MNGRPGWRGNTQTQDGRSISNDIRRLHLDRKVGLPGRGRKIAKVGMARKLAIQLFWMIRKQWDYEQVNRFGPHAGQPENRHGGQ